MSKRAVWKYPMGDWRTGMFSTVMPQGSRILSLQEQEVNDELCMWALVDPEAPMVQRHFVIVGTGHVFDSVPENNLSADNFVGTFQILKGALVFHVFEVFRG